MKRINLLPQEERAKASRERGLIWAILILVAVVVVLGLVYVKLNGDAIAHKTERGLVALDLRDDVAVQQAAARLQAAMQGGGHCDQWRPEGANGIRSG